MANIIGVSLAILLVASGATARGDNAPGGRARSVGSQQISVPKPPASTTPAAAVDQGKPGENASLADDRPAGGEEIGTPEDPGDFYNPIGKVDPFKPLVRDRQVAAAATTVDEKTDRPRRMHLTPLEKVDLSQLKLDGVILAPSGNRAMVSDATGKGYVVTVGTYMGIYSGRVVDILSDRIIVEEEVENIFGKISLRRREMNMQKPPGE